MNKAILLSVLIAIVGCVAAQQPDYPAMRIGGRPIMRSEIDYIMNKNIMNGTPGRDTLTEEANRELFVNFKLKVIEAEECGLDTTRSFRREFNQYRNQLAQPYLTDDSLNQELYHEAYEHFSEDCEVSHVLIRLDENATPADTAAAYQKALEVRKRLLSENFAAVADEVSDDPSVKQNHGYLGFFTAMQTVWPFEREMYSIPIGRISQPVRSAYGYHILKVHSRRPAAGQVHAAHIMLTCNDRMKPDVQERIYQEVLDLKRRINNGESFEELAKDHSDDRGTAQRGGDLSWFGINRMVPEFEQAAFRLQPGQVSEPVKTQFGWHIIKVLGRRGAGTFEQKRAEIGRAIQRDERAGAAKRSFVEKKMAALDMHIDTAAATAVTELMLEHNPADSAFTALTGAMADTVLSYGSHVFTASDFGKYCAAYAVTHVADKSYAKWFYNFIEMIVTDDENMQLEAKHPDFANLVREYHDGILLFDISNREVWDKAIRDTAGLEQFFARNRQNYAFKTPRFKGLLIRCHDKALARSIKRAIRGMDYDRAAAYIRSLNPDTATIATVEQGLWEQRDNETIDRLGFKDHRAEIEQTEKLPETFVVGHMLKNLPDDISDVRGAVTADYQTYLEQQWVEKLRKKYKVEYLK